MPPYRVYLNRAVINRAASSDWPGPIWQTIAVAAWGWTNCAGEPLRSPETIATEAIPSASNREISDIAPWDWGAKTKRRDRFMVGRYMALSSILSSSIPNQGLHIEAWNASIVSS
jgi:hypothetical protein